LAQGIRLIGYGPTRPVFVLGEGSPGYQDKDNLKYMLFSRAGAAAQAGAEQAESSSGA
jgi:hypothetical protein